MFLTQPRQDIAIDARDGKVVRRALGDGPATAIDELAKHEVKDLSRDGSKLALVSEWFQVRNSHKNELVVWNLAKGEAELRLRDYLSYDLVFDARATQLLLNAYGKKTACIDIASGEVVAQGTKELPLHRGARQPEANAFWFASHKKRTAFVFDFGERAFSERKLPSKAKLGTFAFTSNGALLFSDQSNVVRLCPTPDAKKPVWELDMNERFGELGRCGHGGIFLTDDERYAVVEGGFTSEHPTAAELVIELATGEVDKLPPMPKGRGKLTATWADSQLVTFTGKLVAIPGGAITALS